MAAEADEKREPDRLYLADGRMVTGMWLCPAQAHAYQVPSVAASCDCAEPRPCACGRGERHRFSERCPVCHNESHEARERAAWEKATKIAADQYDGPVFDDEDDDAPMYLGIGDLLDHHEDAGIAVAHRVYAAVPKHMEMHAGVIVEHALEDFHEDAASDVSDAAIAELQELLDAWCKKHRVTTWVPDYTRAIVYTPRPIEDDDVST